MALHDHWRSEPRVGIVRVSLRENYPKRSLDPLGVLGWRKVCAHGVSLSLPQLERPRTNHLEIVKLDFKTSKFMTPDSELEEIKARYAIQMAEEAQRELTKAAPQIERFTAIAASRGIVLNATSFEYVQTIGVVAKAPGLAKTLIEPIQTERDELVAYSEIVKKLQPSPFQAGCFVGKDYMLLAHPFYRRKMRPDANWAPRFVEFLWAFDAPGVQKYIAIDEDRVRINVDSSTYIEEDTWHGAPFNEDIRAIKPGTVKLRPPQDLDPTYISSLFADAYCLDIKWSEADGVKTFVSLEMKTEKVQLELDGNIYFPARYMHAEFDISANCFRHFDGAVQLFLEDEYLQRRESDFNMNAKTTDHIKARSKKLFKLNGPINAKNWVDLCCQFYTGNPLTIEYFSKAFPAHINDTLAKIRARNV